MCDKYDHLKELAHPIPLLQSSQRGSISSIRLVKPLFAQAVILLEAETQTGIFISSMNRLNKGSRGLSKSRFVICRVKSVEFPKKFPLDLPEAMISRLSFRLLRQIMNATRSWG